ncbi:MAG: sigma factor-like helix-turn-helix DNA-binding protein [Eubacteriales bacterium]|nr:sigma factor-like helix-turn-helix DNA-binding protein [Eubacteriales bacterium]
MSDPLAAMEQKLENGVEISTLCAFYGGLLTSKQREALTLHYDEDLSLGEIAKHLGVSRQNVHELITRSAEKLRYYEEALGAAGRLTEMLNLLEQARALLQTAQDSALPTEARQAVREADDLIEMTMRKQEEDVHGI